MPLNQGADLLALLGFVVLFGWLLAAPIGKPRRSRLFRSLWFVVGASILGGLIGVTVRC